LIFSIQDDRLASSAQIGCRNLTASHNPGKLAGPVFGSKYILDEWNKCSRACARDALTIAPKRHDPAAPIGAAGTLIS
jgi:hypothetical protein